MDHNSNIDKNLLAEAHRLGGKRTKRETVNEALAEYIGRRKQTRILNIFGTVEFAPDYDHKKLRKRR